jgi:ferredoxin
MTKTLKVNPIACDGHGLCAELFPERISLDDWGYPIVDPEPIPRSLEAHARRAVAACPTLALLVSQTRTQQPEGREEAVRLLRAGPGRSRSARARRGSRGGASA